MAWCLAASRRTQKAPAKWYLSPDEGNAEEEVRPRRGKRQEVMDMNGAAAALLSLDQAPRDADRKRSKSPATQADFLHYI